jgi:hypothetical protein
METRAGCRRSRGIEQGGARWHQTAIKAQIIDQVMEKFTTILGVGALLTGVASAGPAAAGCLEEIAPVEGRARALNSGS